MKSPEFKKNDSNLSEKILDDGKNSSREKASAQVSSQA
jgi:hypothetical protein